MMLKKCLIAALILMSRSLCAQDVNQIMQSYFETVSGGDIANWQKIRTAYIESISYYKDLDAESTSVPSLINSQNEYQRLFRQWPKKLKIELYADSTHHNLLSYNLWLPDKLILVFPNYDPIVKPSKGSSWDFTPVYIYKLVKDAKSKRLSGVREFEADSISCYVIEIVSEGLTLDLYINTSTYLLEYWKVLQPSDSANFVRFTDYKRIDGFLIETHTYAMKNGVIFHADRKTKVVLNSRINEEEFEFH